MLAAMTVLDWSIVVGYLAMALAIGVAFSRRAGKSTNEYFLSGRNLPWWLAGTSMVATSFAADTPLLITGWTREGGIAGNWIWWAWAVGGMLSVFMMSRLWRRAEIMTDVELTERRYSGRSAAALRGFKAAYMALPINCLRIALVMTAMITILKVLFGIEPIAAVLICATIATVYCVLAGFWGVVLTDFIQFILAMGGSIALCVFVVGDFGGLSELCRKAEAASPLGGDLLRFFPSPGAMPSPWTVEFWSMPFVAFVVFITMQWWANMNVDGGGLVVQRMAAARNERHSLLATLWFNVAHYALRPWPWILVALASLVAFPNVAEPGHAYPMMIRDFAPPGLMGVMVATFLAAFMSTIDTQLNLSSAYIVNDFYRRFVRPQATERHYVFVSRLAAIGVMVIASLIALGGNSILGLYAFLISFSSGVGLVYVLRWFWWRTNAWSEMSAMISSSVVAIVLHFVRVPGSEGKPEVLPFALVLLATVSMSAIVSLVVTMLTPPVDEARLVAFYRKVRPYGLWGPIARKAGVARTGGLGRQVVNWLAATAMVFGMMFALGKFLLGSPVEGAAYLAAALIGGAIISREILQRPAAGGSMGAGKAATREG